MAKFIYDEAEIRFEVPDSLLSQVKSHLSKLTDMGATIESEPYWELVDGTWDEFSGEVITEPEKILPSQGLEKAAEVLVPKTYDSTGHPLEGCETGETEIIWRCPYKPNKEDISILQEVDANPVAFHNFKRDFWQDQVLTVTVSGIIKRLGNDLTTPKLDNGDILIGFGKADSTVLTKVYDPDIIIGDSERKLIQEGNCELCKRNTERNLLYLIQRPDGSRYTMGSTCALKAFGVNLKTIMNAYIREVYSKAQEVIDDIDGFMSERAGGRRDYSYPRYESALTLISIDPNDYADNVLHCPRKHQWQLTYFNIKKEEQDKIQEAIKEASDVFKELRDKAPESGFYDNTYVSLRDQPGRITYKWAEAIVRTINKKKGIEAQKELEAPDKPVDAEIGIMTNFENFKVIFIKEPNSTWTFPAWGILIKKETGEKAWFNWSKANPPVEVGDTINFRGKVKRHNGETSSISHVKNIEKIKP